MTDSNRTLSPLVLGPRGWAVLVLAGGAALSAPFLRNPGNPPQNADAVLNPSAVDFSKKSWPDVRENTLVPTDAIATKLSEQDWAELERLKSDSGTGLGTGPRKLTGNLPSTSATPLPSWAERGTRVDQLVNNSMRTEPLAPTPVGSVGLDPLRPWMGAGMKSNVESAASSSQLAGPSGDLVFRAPNPDARWNSTPAASPNSGTLPQDAASQNSGALASNRPFRKFEDRVTQWPDEKLLPGQVDHNQFKTNRLDSGQVAWGQSSSIPQTERSEGSSNSVFPPVLPPQVTQTQITQTQAAFQTQVPQPFEAPTLMPEKPDTVSAPMVSSQSGRQAPPLTTPAIEGPKPSSPTAPRQKHFIQQPAKRA